MNKYIEVEKLSVQGEEVHACLSCSKEIKRYIVSDFYAKYDVNIQNVDNSILGIPAISNIITLGWVTGADIFVKELDETYLKSLDMIKAVMKEMYPRFPFSSKIHVDRVVSNKFSGEKSALLFSGGVDSTTSYIKHKNEKPDLFVIGGADVPLSMEKLWNNLQKETRMFADREDIEVNYIETNIQGFINGPLLGLEYGKHLTNFGWWGAIQHGMGLLGLCAPLTVVKNIKSVYIASSQTVHFKKPWGSDPSIDSNVSWADVNVVHDGFELNTQEKIRYVLREYIEKTGYYPRLRVCYKNKTDDFNCGECEKCSRRIVGLSVEGVDPNKCGFNVNDKTFNLIRKKLMENKFSLLEATVYQWKTIQKHIPEMVDHNLYESKEFFEWLKDFEISENIPLLFLVYFNLPWGVHKFLSRTKVLHAVVALHRRGLI